MNNIVKLYKKFVEKISEKYFHYSGDVVYLNSGTKGAAFITDNGKKIIKITSDDDEALRAERIRGKSYKNLINYYDVRKIKSSNLTIDGKYCLLMDKLPKVLTDDETLLSIFDFYCNIFNIPYSGFNMPGYDISDSNKLKGYINDNISEYSFYEDLDDIYKVKAKRMWFDLIKIRKQLSKCGIETNDLTRGNLGYNSNGDLIFFDIGYPGWGGKKLKPNKEIQVQVQGEEGPKRTRIRSLKPKLESFDSFNYIREIKIEI